MTARRGDDVRRAGGAPRWVLGAAFAVLVMLLVVWTTTSTRSDVGGAPTAPPPERVWIRVTSDAPTGDMTVYDALGGAAIAGLEITNAADLDGTFGWVRISQLWIVVHESSWNRFCGRVGLPHYVPCASVESKTWNYEGDRRQPSHGSVGDDPAAPRWIELCRR